MVSPKRWYWYMDPDPPNPDPEYACPDCGSQEDPVTEETWRGPPGGEWKVIQAKCPDCGHILYEEDG